MMPAGAEQEPKSRRLVISMRSFHGSRTALLNVAVRMLITSRELELEGGASDYWCFRASDQRDFLTAAVLYRSRLTVEQVVKLMQAVEARLQDTDPPTSPPAIELRLLWMEGVQSQTQELTLPSSLLETERWASLVLIEAAEDALLEAVDEKTESASVVQRIATAYVKLKKASVGLLWSFSPNEPVGKSLEQTPAGLVLEAGGIDRPDALVAATELMLLAERLPPTPELGDSSLEEAEEKLKESTPNAQAFVEINLPSSLSTEKYALAWLDAIRKTAASSQLEVTDIVIWESSWSLIRGCLFGRKAKNVKFSRKLQGLQIEKQEHASIPLTRVSLQIGDKS